MATFYVEEIFPGATIEGMAARRGFNAIPGSSEGIRSVHTYDHMDATYEAEPTLECLMRKGFARSARMGKLEATLAETPAGVQAIGKFGPDEDRGCCAIVLSGLIMLGMAMYFVITRHSVVDFVTAAVLIVVIRYAPRIGVFFAYDDWNAGDLHQVLRAVHEMYDGANAPAAEAAGDEAEGKT